MMTSGMHRRPFEGRHLVTFLYRLLCEQRISTFLCCLPAHLLLFASTFTAVCQHIYCCLPAHLLLFASTFTAVCQHIYCCFPAHLLLFASTFTAVCQHIYCCLPAHLLLFASTFTAVCQHIYCCLPAHLLLFASIFTDVNFVLQSAGLASCRSCARTDTARTATHSCPKQGPTAASGESSGPPIK